MIKIHIPTEQYGFIEIDCESLEDAKDKYLEAKEIFANSQGGLDDKTWRSVLDKYLTEKTMSADEYAEMSDKQKNIIQEIKRAFNRIKICMEK